MVVVWVCEVMYDGGALVKGCVWWWWGCVRLCMVVVGECRVMYGNGVLV